jgi:hypothetical protein
MVQNHRNALENAVFLEVNQTRRGLSPRTMPHFLKVSQR